MIEEEVTDVVLPRNVKVTVSRKHEACRSLASVSEICTSEAGVVLVIQFKHAVSLLVTGFTPQSMHSFADTRLRVTIDRNAHC